MGGIPENICTNLEQNPENNKQQSVNAQLETPGRIAAEEIPRGAPEGIPGGRNSDTNFEKNL